MLELTRRRRPGWRAAGGLKQNTHPALSRLAVESLEPRMMLAGDGLLGSYFNEGNQSTPISGLAGARVDATINFPNDDLGGDAQGMVDNDDNYAIRWTGWVLADQAGTWKFTTFSNDGVRVWVDDTQLVDHWNTHTSARDDGTIPLAAGWHEIKLEYFQQNGTTDARLLFSGPGQSEVIIPQTHLSSTNPVQGIRPTADAGSDILLLLPEDSTTLDGSATDDGTVVSYVWTQLSGPSMANLANETTEDLIVSGLISGIYEFQLAVADNDGNTDTDTALVTVAQLSGDGVVTGELKKWHKLTITFDGPATSETATINPFLSYRLDVTFLHADSGKTFVVPGYYAADGNAGNSSAASGNKWRVHFSPSEEGEWSYLASFRFGTEVAVDHNPLAGNSAGFFDGAAGVFNVDSTDKTGRDFRGKGLLQYVGERYLKFAETGQYFLKQGADAPENFLAYEDFDGPFASDGQKDDLVKDWSPHVRDWQRGDPTWGDSQGKGIIGAVNYLASEGQNAFSFLSMNVGGDDRNVFPYLNYSERLRMDVSRLAQWEVVFEHADEKGMFLHFKTQETENELLLDGGDLGTQRTLYYRELIARFSHHLALNWNLGEEVNNATKSQKQDWAQYFWNSDPYQHHIVIHNGNNHFELMGQYDESAGTGSELTGFSLQTSSPEFTDSFSKVTDYLTRSKNAGKLWPVALDEPGDASHALRPDNDAGSSQEDGRKNGLWATLLAGGWGNEWYFGYQHDHSDLTLNDFRSRDQWWDVTRYALEFFNDNSIPFWEMNNDNALSTAADDYGFAKPGEVYVVYLKDGGTTNLNLSGATGTFNVQWFDPRHGGDLQTGTVAEVAGGGVRSLGSAPNSTGSDWTILVRRQPVLGDYDHNGTVDLNDYDVWRADFGRSDKLDADGNRDGVINSGDFTVWQDNYAVVPLAAPTAGRDIAEAAFADIRAELATRVDAMGGEASPDGHQERRRHRHGVRHSGDPPEHPRFRSRRVTSPVKDGGDALELAVDHVFEMVGSRRR